jgi:hypothetical protein
MAPAPIDHAPDTSQPQPVSGWSIFWALFAIVSHAMLQPSFAGYFLSGDVFEGSLWPHRSSPFICLVDSVVDAYLVIKAIRKRVETQEDTGAETRSGSPGTMTKVALFGLGVLPQAIKLFSLRGISVTQAVAAMFLLPSTVNLICSLLIASPERELQKLVPLEERKTGREQRSSTKTEPRKRWTYGNLKRSIFIFGCVPHGIGVFLIWQGFLHRIGISAPDNLFNAVCWLHIFGIFAVAIYMVQHGTFIILGYEPLVSCKQQFWGPCSTCILTTRHRFHATRY